MKFTPCKFRYLLGSRRETEGIQCQDRYCPTSGDAKSYRLKGKSREVTEAHITLKEIASFLGVTPETISHIRRKLLQK